jgi:hypothetical protein
MLQKVPLGNGIEDFKFFFCLRDSKNIIEVDLKSKITRSHRTARETPFPHNFQCVRSPMNSLYLIGGGDYQKDDDSLYQLHEIKLLEGCTIEKKDNMRFPRHGHSACWFSDKFLVVTGSRKEKNNSHKKCEMYNSDLDIWFDMPDLNVGRHYHSSC